MSEGSEFKAIQPHIRCREGDVARYVFLPGAPARARVIADAMDEASVVAENREYVVITGHSDGIEMSVCSTGIGSPSAAIAIEELGKVGADTFIRVGSAGGYQENIKAGDLVIVTAAYRGEGTSQHYLPPEFPAVADYDVTQALITAAQQLEIPVHVGLGSSGDAFYAKKDPDRIELMHQAGLKCGEMECSALFIIGALRRWRVGAIVAIDGNIYLRQRKTADTEALFHEAERQEARIAIAAVKLLEQRSITGGGS